MKDKRRNSVANEHPRPASFIPTCRDGEGAWGGATLDTKVISPLSFILHPSSTIKAVVLDLDGTLYDKRGIVRRMVLGQLGSLSVLAAEQRSKKALRGHYFGTEEAFYARFFEAMSRGHLYNARVARWWYFHIYMPLMVLVLRLWHTPRAWVKPLIEECHRRGIYLAVYSDYGCVHEKLRALGLNTNDFCYLVSAPELGGLKPAKECAEKVLKTLGVAPEETLFVGDRDDTDGESARAVGAQFFLIKD